ncbi:MAG: hypothetical protein LBM99_03540 [Bacillales bacterium]|jgi:capsular polysaccharide biosynthesis protein|nr:hypothetical protein [Bacillales bacterium]
MNEEIMENETSGISLVDIWLKIKRHIVFIIVSCIVGTILGVAYTYTLQKREYTAHAVAIVYAEPIGNQTDTSLYQFATLVINSYIDILNSPRMKEEVKTKLGLETLLYYKLTPANKTNSLLVYIDVVSYERDYSIDLADAFLEESVKIASEYEVFERAKIQKMQPAFSEAKDATRHGLRNTAIGFAIGLVVAAIYVLIKLLVDNTFKREEELVKILNTRVLAVLPSLDFDAD